MNTKSSLALLLFVSVASQALAAPSPAPAKAPMRTIHTLPDFPVQSLRHSLTPQLYKSLGVSPILAWVVVRAPVSGASTSGAKIVHSDAGGTFDKMALDLANDYRVTGTNTIESRMALDYLTVHLLVYKIADGYMAIDFANLDDSRYSDYRQSGQAWVGILKDGKWTTISRPPGRYQPSYPN